MHGSHLWILNYLGVIEPVVAYVDEFLVSTFGKSTGTSLVEYFEEFIQNALSLNIISSLSFVVTFLTLIDKLNITVNNLFHNEKNKIQLLDF